MIRNRALSLVMSTVLLLTLLTSCSQSGPTGTPTPVTEISPTPLSEPSPTPEPELFVPEDIFGSKFDPFSNAGFPDNFTIYGAMFDIGIEKLGGMPHFTLSMTAENETQESIRYLAGLAGLEDEEAIASHLEGFFSYGYCEFQDPDGSVFAIRRTDRHDDRYEYVDGLHADIITTLSEEDAAVCLQLFSDNFNISALAAVSDHFDTTPPFGECVFAVNLHKQEVSMDMMYPVSDVQNVWDQISGEIKYDWYDSENEKLGYSYGIFNLQLILDRKDGNIYVTERTSVTDSVLSAYVEPEVSLVKLGFGFGQDNICGVYEQREPHYMSIAIHRGEWGMFNENWNIEFLDQLNGYMLRITYMEDEDKFHFSADKDDTGAAFDYYEQAGKYDGEYPDKDTVTRIYNDVFGTSGEGFYYKPVEYLELVVQERFGMSIMELYELPAR